MIGTPYNKILEIEYDNLKLVNVVKMENVTSLHRSVDCENFIGLKEEVYMWCSKPLYVQRSCIEENLANYVFNLLKFVAIAALKQCSELLPTRAA